MKKIRLSELTYSILSKWDAWKVIEETIEDEDIMLDPANKNEHGLIDRNIGEVWCLCIATFSNGSKHKAVSMCRGDSNDGPLLWSFWNGSRDVSLVVPPAPEFVLDIDGPVPFSKEFDLSVNDVFPIKLEVVPKFESNPTVRRILIYETGVAEFANPLLN